MDKFGLELAVKAHEDDIRSKKDKIAVVIHSSIPEYPLISSPYPLQSKLNTTAQAAVFLRHRTVGRLCSAPPPYLNFRPLFFGLYCSKTLQKHGFLLIFGIEPLFYACNCTQNHYSRVQKYYTRGLMTKNDQLETYPM